MHPITTRIIQLLRLPVASTAGIVVAALLSACDPSPPPGQIGTLDVRTPRFTSAGVEGCLHCHAGSFNRAIESTAHGDRENPATPYGQQGCESCHGPGSFHASRAHGGRGVPGLIAFGHGPGSSPRALQLDACLSCHHSEADGPARIAFIGSAHDSPYVNCSTCHAVHSEASRLASPSGQAEVCFACHESQRAGHVKFRGRSLDFSAWACSRCHSVH